MCRKREWLHYIYSWYFSGITCLSIMCASWVHPTIAQFAIDFDLESSFGLSLFSIQNSTENLMHFHNIPQKSFLCHAYLRDKTIHITIIIVEFTAGVHDIYSIYAIPPSDLIIFAHYTIHKIIISLSLTTIYTIFIWCSFLSQKKRALGYVFKGISPLVNVNRILL